MTAVIPASPETTTDALAPAALAPAPGRATPGDFDLLMALLQGALASGVPTTSGTPSPGVPTSGVPASAPPGVPPTEAPAEPVASAQAALTVPARRLTRPSPGGEAAPGLAPSAEPLGSPDDDGLEAQSGPALAPILLGATPSPALTSVPVSAPGSDTRPPAVSVAGDSPVDLASVAPGLAVPRPAPALHAPQVASAHEVGGAVGEAPAPSATLVAPSPVPPATVPEATEPVTPTELRSAVATEAAEEAKPRPLVARGGERFGERHGAAAQELVAADALARASADAPAPALRPAPSRDDSSRPGARASRDTEAAVAPSSDVSMSAASTPAPAAGARAGLEDAESARPEPVRQDPVDQVVTRLREVRTPGRHEISVRLDPPDLGAVRIDARLEGARLTVQIRAEHVPTGELLTDALPRIREALSQQGFAPGDISVHLGLDASGRHSARDSAPTFTPPRDHEPSPQPRAVPAAAPVAAATDGLDVWA
jgi:hypothetical protein